jgi:hypothetical protein
LHNKNKYYSSKICALLILISIVTFCSTIALAEDKKTSVWEVIKKTSESVIDSSINSLDLLIKDIGKIVEKQRKDYENEKENNSNVDIRDKIDTIRLYVENINQLKKQEQNASTFTLTSQSKKDYRIKIDQVLTELEGTLFDGEIVNYSERIRSTRLNIKRLKQKKANLNEDLVFAPTKKGMFKNNKGEIQDKIKNIENIIDDSNSLINELEFDLKRKLNALGISLTREQIKVMTTRVDGDDLSKTFAIFDVTKQITNTLGRLMKQNAFSPKTTVKYYGTYVILSEILGYSQRNYIGRIDKIYLPAIEKIENDIEKSIDFTNNAINKSTSEDNKIVLLQNIKSNKFSLEVLEQYERILKEQKKSLLTALKNTREQITVAYSTYDTASNSANLLNLINQTQGAFDKIMNLQVPNIIPFSNIALQNKFEELSDKMVLDRKI